VRALKGKATGIANYLLGYLGGHDGSRLSCSRGWIFGKGIENWKRIKQRYIRRIWSGHYTWREAIVLAVRDYNMLIHWVAGDTVLNWSLEDNYDVIYNDRQLR
jgi:hypothetical protein